MKINIIIFWLFCCSAITANTKEPNLFLSNLTNQLLIASSDSSKLEISNTIFKILQQELTNNIDIDDINRIAKVISNDKKLSIFTWAYELNNGNFIIDGIYRYINDDGMYIINRLTHSNNISSKLILATLSESNWFGALYYAIIDKKIDETTYYTLLGLNPVNMYKNIKVVDVVRFNKRNGLRFGAPIFEKNDLKVNRLIFEYSESIFFSLKYQEEFDRIIFDHLSNSKNDNHTNNYQVPDMSFDALVFKKDRWIFKENIEIRNNAKSKRKNSRLSRTGMFGVKRDKRKN